MDAPNRILFKLLVLASLTSWSFAQQQAPTAEPQRTPRDPLSSDHRLWKSLGLDQFAGIKCGADIPESLVGKRDSNEPVAAIEGRHKELGLKNLGGTEISDRLFLASWQICGSEYELLVNTKTGLIRDVLPFPAHSAASPMFVGRCQAGGKEIPETVLAVLNNSAGYNARDQKLAKTLLKATAAWRIDESKEKFAQRSPENLLCPLIGIVTQDGGP